MRRLRPRNAPTIGSTVSCEDEQNVFHCVNEYNPKRGEQLFKSQRRAMSSFEWRQIGIKPLPHGNTPARYPQFPTVCHQRATHTYIYGYRLLLHMRFGPRRRRRAMDAIRDGRVREDTIFDVVARAMRFNVRSTSIGRQLLARTTFYVFKLYTYIPSSSSY